MSGVNPASSRDWSFGPIPADWRALPLKYLCTRSSLYGANVGAEIYESAGVRFLRTTDIRDDGTLNEGGVFLPAAIVVDYMLSEGDLLISRSGTVGRAYVYRLNDGPCAYAGYLVRYALRDRNTPRWLFHITKTPGFQQWLGASAIEATIGNVNGEKYANLLVPVPPLPQQRAIADYLDRETTRLDALVAAKERLLELLAEKRRALITRAVTCGLDTRAPLCDADVASLDEIPAHWATNRLKFIAQISYGVGDELDKSLTSGVPLISLPNVDIEGLLHLEELGWADLSESEKSPLLLRKGDLLFNWRNGSSAHVGKTAYFDAEGEFTHVGFLLRIRFDQSRYEPRFFQALLQTLRATGYFLYTRAMVNNTFNQTELGNLFVVVPTLAEQRAIVTYIATETVKLDAMRAATDRTIDLLKERRAALIAAAVTGQLDVTRNERHV